MNSPKSAREPFFRKNLTLRQKLTRRLTAFAGLAIGTAALAGFAGQTDLAIGLSPEPAIVGASAKEGLPAELIAAVEVNSFERKRIYTGIVKASRTSEVGFERTGRLIAVLVDEGDEIEAGRVLARLDTRSLEAQREELVAKRDAATAVLDELVDGPRQETIDAARAEVRDLAAQVKLSQLRYARSKSLIEKRAISKDEFEEREIGLSSIEARRDAAQRRLDELEKGTRQQQIDAQRAAVAQLAAALDRIDVELSNSEIRAPFAGVVASRRFDEGAIIAPSSPVLRIVESGKLEAWIGVPTATASRLNRDESFTLSIDGRSVTGALQAVLPEVDAATRTQTVVFSLPPHSGHAPAQVVRVELSERVNSSGVWAPMSALTRGSRGLWAVLVAERGANDRFIAARRDVELLYSDGQRALVQGTLLDGDRILAGGAHRFSEGQTILALPTTDQTDTVAN